MTELREETEKSYLSRFKHAHGAGVYSQVRYLEGTFCSEERPQQNAKLIFSVLKRVLGIPGVLICPLEWVHDKPLTVSQVLDNLERVETNGKLCRAGASAALIKRKPKRGEVYPYALLFKDLKNQASILMDMLKHEPRLIRWIRGVDAAAITRCMLHQSCLDLCSRVLAKIGCCSFYLSCWRGLSASDQWYSIN